MKRLTCEMCGSTDMLKEEGAFVCQSCGCKYSVEEAKKMMVEVEGTVEVKGTVEVTGSVKIDHQDEYENYILVAKQLLSGGSWQSGYDACEKALALSPTSGEAWFIKAKYLNKHGYKSEEEIVSAFKYAFEYLKDSERDMVCETIFNIVDEEVKTATVHKLNFRKWCLFITGLDQLTVEEKNDLYKNKIVNWYKNVYSSYMASKHGSLDAYVAWCVRCGSSKNEDWWRNRELCKYLNELNEKNGFAERYPVYEQMVINIANPPMLTTDNFFFGETHVGTFDNITKQFKCIAFGDIKHVKLLNTPYEKRCMITPNNGLAIIFAANLAHPNDVEMFDSMMELLEKDVIAKYNIPFNPNSNAANGAANNTPNNTANNTPKKGGCYVATCVYGSYDCPQVWTLRRYRDETLGATWYGRMFIRTYYAVSPTIVKLFGNTKWFKKMWKGKLDSMVAKLQSQGVENTPYEDKSW